MRTTPSTSPKRARRFVSREISVSGKIVFPDIFSVSQSLKTVFKAVSVAASVATNFGAGKSAAEIILSSYFLNETLCVAESVLIFISVLSVFFVIFANTAEHLNPLPQVKPSDPSALKIRIKKSPPRAESS